MTETFVLVHSPLVGPSTWTGVAERLREAGHEAVVPSLAGVTDGPPPYYPALATRVAEQVGMRDQLALVAHSGAGVLLPGIAAAVSGAVHAAMFVDAVLPHPGESSFDTMPAGLRAELAAAARGGRLPPWHEWFPPDAIRELLPDPVMRDAFIAELPALPLAYFDEAAPHCACWPPPHLGYIQLSEAYDSAAEEAVGQGWRVIRERLDHLAPLTRPGQVADLIDEVTHAGGAS